MRYEEGIFNTFDECCDSFWKHDTCSVCKKSEQRTVGKKLSAAMKVNTYYLLMKFRQKTTSLKVTGLIEGDSIVSWEIREVNTKYGTIRKAS